MLKKMKTCVLHYTYNSGEFINIHDKMQQLSTHNISVLMKCPNTLFFYVDEKHISITYILYPDANPTFSETTSCFQQTISVNTLFLSQF